MYIDTGAMYRAVALLALRGGCVSGDNAVDETALRRLLVGGGPVDISFRTSGPGGRSETWLDGENVEKEIRTMEISRIVSHVAALPFVKIFMTARPEVRARRRYEEMSARGHSVSYVEILGNLSERDYIDTHRETAPLRMAGDAVLLDNSDMSIEDQIQWFKDLLKQRHLCGY